MANKHLSTYLNDHLAGSVVLMELLEHVASAYAGTDIAGFAETLRAEIAGDRAELESLMARLDISQSRTRKTTAWLGEKLSELKLRMDDPRAGAFRLLEAMEAASIGIEGKRLLWQSLIATSTDAPELQGPDYATLTERAIDQRARVETVRTEAAKLTLAAGK